MIHIFQKISCKDICETKDFVCDQKIKFVKVFREGEYGKFTLNVQIVE